VTELIIDAHYNGPNDSGNGGYCCGRFAHSLDPDPLQAVEVTLRRPPPLDTLLHAVAVDDGMEIRQDINLIATARRAVIDFEPLSAPELTQARQAESRYIGLKDHPFPNCFVCGPERHQHDGLRLFPGIWDTSRDANNAVACHWQPFAALADSDGFLRPEFIWAALDCPTYSGAFAGQENGPTAVLGRQAVRSLQTQLPWDETYLIQSWQLASDGRKHTSAGALYSVDGECLALCKATWIVL
jgi:hypothetical protein